MDGCIFFAVQDTVFNIMAPTIIIKKKEIIERGIAFKERFTDMCLDSFILPLMKLHGLLQKCGAGPRAR